MSAYTRPPCAAHEVVGCTNHYCRARALGLTIEDYRRWVLGPVRRSRRAPATSIRGGAR